MSQTHPQLHEQAKKKMLFSLCRGFIFGNKGCFGFEWVYDNRECVDKIMSLLITARSGLGSVLELELGRDGVLNLYAKSGPK